MPRGVGRRRAKEADDWVPAPPKLGDGRLVIKIPLLSRDDALAVHTRPAGGPLRLDRSPKFRALLLNVTLVGNAAINGVLL